MDTQTQVERLIELAIVQRTELRQLVEQLPQLRDHLNAEIERTFEEVEPQIRTELEEFCAARAIDEHAKTGAALAAKVDELSRQLEATTSAKYSVLMAERAHNVELERIATEQVAQAAKEIPQQVKAIVADELSRFPRAGEIDQLRKEFATPAGLNPRGKWQSGQTYERLDVVSYNGNSYIANGKTSEKPSADSSAWTINAARGTGGGGPSSLNELTQTPTNGSVLIGSGTSWVTSTLTAGAGISIANAAGSITITGASGTIALNDGTAAAPSLNFTNYPTTGLYSSAANAIGFATSGVSRATISSAGVTIASTTSAGVSSGALVVTGGISTADNIFLGNSKTISFGGSGAVITGSNGGQTFDFTVGGDTYFRLRNTGVIVSAAGVLDAGIFQIAEPSLGVTAKDGAAIFNLTAASAGTTVQMSPRLRLKGSAWNTSASQTCDWTIDNLPASAATPTAALRFGFSLNGAAYTYPIVFQNSGAAAFAGAVTIAGNVGFYNQAATAKPTGVAVSAAAIHAALVTLNLIAA